MDFLSRAAASVRTGFRTVWPSCRDASRLQSLAQDQTISGAKRFGLKLHLLLCGWCRRYGRQVRFLRHAVHEHPETGQMPSDGHLSPAARERMRDVLRDASR